MTKLRYFYFEILTFYTKGYIVKQGQSPRGSTLNISMLRMLAPFGYLFQVFFYIFGSLFQGFYIFGSLFPGVYFLGHLFQVSMICLLFCNFFPLISIILTISHQSMMNCLVLRFFEAHFARNIQYAISCNCFARFAHNNEPCYTASKHLNIFIKASTH